jgi:RNA binding exosome subunit
LAEEIQSVEISYFIHATEDPGRISRAVAERFGLSQPPELEDLEGHFGNKIVHVQYHLTGHEAMTTFRGIVSFIGSEGVQELLAGLELTMDERKALYIRFSKQEFLKGVPVLSSVDPIRVKVKPRGFMIRGNAGEFYARLMGEAG